MTTQSDQRRTYRLFSPYIAFAGKRAALLLLVFAILTELGLSRAAPLLLHLHSDFYELLPPRHPAVLAARRVTSLQKGASTNLQIIIHSPSKEANERLADALREPLEALVPKTLSEIQWKPDPEPSQYAQRWKWLYAETKDLENAEDLLDRVIAKRSSPAYVELDGDAEEELKRLREKLNKQVDDRVKPVPPDNYFEMTDPPEKGGESWLGVTLWRKGDGLATAGDRETVEAVKAAVAAVSLSSFHPQMKLEYSGNIAIAIDEQNGIRDDVTLSFLVVVLLVLAVIYAYFRRLALIVVVFAPAVFGTLAALSLVSVTIGYLNLNTAFLISILIGNGINAPIIMLARYGEERQRGLAVPDALAVAMSETFLGTLTAVAAASIAYGSLVLTSFRGFNQFGVLGGAGMLLVWLSMFFVVPPMVLLGERLFPGQFTPRRNLFRLPFAALGRLTNQSPAWFSLMTVVLLVAAIPGVMRFANDPLEWNLDNLRSDPAAVPAQSLWDRRDALGIGNVGAGYVGNNAVLFVDAPDQAGAVAQALLAKDRQNPKPYIRLVRTLWSELPKNQAEKLEILGHIRRKIDRHREIMSDEEKKETDAWRPPDYLREVSAADLPRVLREAFTDTDGQVGRLIGVDAEYANYSDWDGHTLLRMAETLSVDALGKRWVAAAAGNIFAGMLEALFKDGPLVSLAAIIGVALLVLGAFGPRGAVPVLASLGIGIVWWLALVGRCHVHVNAMNFAALPITLGVGADYAANIWARLRRDGGPLPSIIAETGSAVALCSLTTIIGYSSLLMSHNRALRSFGLAANLGEVACLAAALVALPALIRLVRRDRPDG